MDHPKPEEHGAAAKPAEHAPPPKEKDEDHPR
jgi:hypothetical protein